MFCIKITISKFTRHIGVDDFIELKASAFYISNKESDNLNYNDNIIGF